MAVNIGDLSEKERMIALTAVARTWLACRGVDAFVSYAAARDQTAAYNELPGWAISPGEATKDSDKLVRRMLLALDSSDDADVRDWLARAVEEIKKGKGHLVDPITLGIGGLILIGAILAARVKKIGATEFYEGVPENLAKVIKAGSSIPLQ